MRSRPKKKTNRRSTASSVKGRISHWGKTDVGLKREVNEDFFLADANLNLYIVADGMGGHAGGDTASRMAVETIREKISQAKDSDGLFVRGAVLNESPAILKVLDEAVRTASAAIFEASQSNPELEGMGTTTTLMLTHGKRAYVAHVGDSRLYQFKNSIFSQVTEDHSLVNEQIKAGFITPEEALHSRFRNIITRSVGFESQVTADTFSFAMKSGDVYLLCSDGLNGMISDEKMGKTLRRGKLSTVPTRLVAAANQNGGDDNITVLVIQYGKTVRKDRRNSSARAGGARRSSKKRK